MTDPVVFGSRTPASPFLTPARGSTLNRRTLSPLRLPHLELHSPHNGPSQSSPLNAFSCFDPDSLDPLLRESPRLHQSSLPPSSPPPYVATPATSDYLPEASSTPTGEGFDATSGAPGEDDSDSDSESDAKPLRKKRARVSHKNAIYGKIELGGIGGNANPGVQAPPLSKLYPCHAVQH